MYSKKFLNFFFLLLLIISFTSCSIKKNKYQFFKKGPIKVALVLSGPVNDSSWNEQAYSGLKRFQANYMSMIAVVDKVNLDEAQEVFHGLAKRKFNLVIANGYEYELVLKKAARLFPKTFFCVIGGEVGKEPNLCSFNFKDEQYGYLIGVAAGLNTSTNKVGIVVGKKLPSIERTIIGMRKGLKSVNPKADLVVSYINTYNDITKGREAGIAQINTGVDVITHLADISGVGVIKAAEELDISAIGAITDEHDLAPSTVLTSGIEDVSQLAYLVSEYYFEHILEPRIYSFGLRHQVIDLTPSYGNIEPTTEAKINRIKGHLTDLETAYEKQLEERGKKR
ncbi:MAG: BMP family protein [Candidatus Melainabacteria bacterium]|nr:BMP family protein [Candidatus Melainabacteria bacterium]